MAGHEQYPTVAELIPGFTVSALLGFVAPAGTPRPVLQKLSADTAAVLRDPDTRKRFEDLGMEVVASTPAEFEAFVRNEIRRWGIIVTEAKIEAD